MEETKRTIEELVNKTGFDINEIKFCEEDGGLWCCIKTTDSSLMIGNSGETLSAINFITRRMLEAKNKDKEVEFIIDVNDYQKKRIDNLKTKAHMMAERARFFKASIEIEPMSGYERRVIHKYLDGQPDIKTESAGFGRNRHIVIKYISNSL